MEMKRYPWKKNNVKLDWELKLGKETKMTTKAWIEEGYETVLLDETERKETEMDDAKRIINKKIIWNWIIKWN